jgi:hypothetical protein
MWHRHTLHCLLLDWLESKEGTHAFKQVRFVTVR